MAIIDIDMVSTVDLSGSTTYDASDVQQRPHETFLKDVGHRDMLQKVGSLHDTYSVHYRHNMYRIMPHNSSKNSREGKVATSPVGAHVDKSENHTAALCFKKRKELQVDPQIKLLKGFR
ncbi:hypothetical protein BPAE_0213g00020 [Botrytis paeoniae]|uniref:Uncharacterized protein n=1 Tax=Botrytis paeoniae TaxID=278948 RepID=A0A4Z1FE02_9HELO|nr:hypothetical protein BPAE_0213g00020 [Botrytis paeoniae]